MSVCRKCGEPTEHVVTLVVDGEDYATAVLCESCEETAKRGIEPWRRRFELLLANGVPRERANEILIGMMRRRVH